MKAAWRVRHARDLIELRLVLDPAAEAARLAAVPAEGAKVAVVADEAEFRRVFDAAYPGVGERRKAAMDVLAAINPFLGGWRLPLAAPYDTVMHDPLVDGRWIARLQDRLVCYDLRAANAVVKREHFALNGGRPQTAPPPVPTTGPAGSSREDLD